MARKGYAFSYLDEHSAASCGPARELERVRQRGKQRELDRRRTRGPNGLNNDAHLTASAGTTTYPASNAAGRAAG